MGLKRGSVGDNRPTGPLGPSADVSVAGALPPADLHARLKSLRPRDDEAVTAPASASYLTFWLAGEEYALPLARAREIVRCEAITKVPQTAAWLRGVTNVRGSVVPVIDLAPRLGRPETAVGARTSILLVEVDWVGDLLIMGVLIDAVGRVLTVAPEEVQATPSFGTRLRADLLSGLIPADGRFAAILDADRALAPKELLPRANPLEEPGGAGARATS